MGWIYRVKVTDLGPFRCIRRDDLLALDMREMTNGWSVEMMVKAARAGYRYHEVPVRYMRRIGVSKVGGTLKGSARAGWCIISTTLKYSRCGRPDVIPGAARNLDRGGFDQRSSGPRGRRSLVAALLGMTDTQRLYIAAKAPRAGLAKTRLAAAIGDEAALALYRAFLADLAARFCDGPFSLGWYVTPADAWRDLAAICGAGSDVLVLEQGEGSWTERQRRLFAGMAGRGETRTVLTASDSPQMSREAVADAFAQLERHDVVLGPVHDGGYYLVGMNAPHDVLAGVQMSTATVAEEIAARCAALGLSLGKVDATFDVDEVADLHALASALDSCPATREAIQSLALSAL